MKSTLQLENHALSEWASASTSLARRRFLGRALVGAATLFAVPGVFAEALTLTARQTEGPFYPDKMPLDTDNDLLVLNDRITPAVGEVTYLHGTVKDRRGKPIPNALVEIWQTDNHGSYIHTKGGNNEDGGKRDANFQGYGRFLTDREGRYFFRTIKPVRYPGRTPHIHCAVSHGSKRILTSQCYIKGHPANANDGVLKAVQDARARKSLMAEWRPIPDSKIGELVAKWNIVVGLTPEDQSVDPFRGPRR